MNKMFKNLMIPIICGACVFGMNFDTVEAAENFSASVENDFAIDPEDVDLKAIRIEFGPPPPPLGRRPPPPPPPRRPGSPPRYGPPPGHHHGPPPPPPRRPGPGPRR